MDKAKDSGGSSSSGVSMFHTNSSNGKLSSLNDMNIVYELNKIMMETTAKAGNGNDIYLL